MKLNSKVQWTALVAVLLLAPLPPAPAQAPTEDKLKELERRAEEIEKKEAAAKAEAQRKAKEKAALEAKRISAENKSEEERRAAEEARAARQKTAELAGEFVDIPAGTFQMGCSPGDSECDDHERPGHPVSIKSFRMGKYEVTQTQWQAVMGENPSHFSNCGGDCPVESVSFDDIRGKPARLTGCRAKRNGNMRARLVRHRPIAVRTMWTRWLGIPVIRAIR